jgi:hypothetical protein
MINEVDISRLVETVDPFDLSASQMEMGSEAGKITWRNALETANTNPHGDGEMTQSIMERVLYLYSPHDGEVCTVKLDANFSTREAERLATTMRGAIKLKNVMLKKGLKRARADQFLKERT